MKALKPYKSIVKFFLNLISFLLLSIAVKSEPTLSPTSQNRPLCASKLIEKTLSNYSRTPVLRLLQGEEIKYTQNIAEQYFEEILFNDDQGYFSEVKLHVDPNDNIDEIASALAQGRSVEAVKIKILKHLALAEYNIPLTDLLPSYPRIRTGLCPKDLYGEEPTLNSPNCWNATLNWHNPHLGDNFTSNKEITEQLDANYSLLKPGDHLQLGDIIVIRYREGIVHTAIHINDSIVWHKASSQPSHPWVFETFKSAISYYVKSDLVDLRIEFYRYQSKSKSGLQN